MKFIITTHWNEIFEYKPKLYSEYFERSYTKEELWQDLNARRFIPVGENKQIYPMIIKTIELVD